MRPTWTPVQPTQPTAVAAPAEHGILSATKRSCMGWLADPNASASAALLATPTLASSQQRQQRLTGTSFPAGNGLTRNGWSQPLAFLPCRILSPDLRLSAHSGSGLEPVSASAARFMHPSLRPDTDLIAAQPHASWHLRCNALGPWRRIDLSFLVLVFRCHTHPSPISLRSRSPPSRGSAPAPSPIDAPIDFHVECVCRAAGQPGGRARPGRVGLEGSNCNAAELLNFASALSRIKRWQIVSVKNARVCFV